MYPLKIVGSCDVEKTGTEVHFLPDKEIFEDTVYDYNVLKQRLREMPFLLGVFLTPYFQSQIHLV